MFYVRADHRLAAATVSLYDARMSKIKKSRLVIRNATLADVKDVVRLSNRVYRGKGLGAESPEMIRGRISAFAKGQFVAVFEGEIVGYCATFIIEEKFALKQHTWGEITGHGYAARHNPLGDYLYGMEICVDESVRGFRIGQRLYDERKRLCRDLDLKGIVFGGRMPGYARRKKNLQSTEDYVRLVQEKEVRDPVINFQMKNGFEILGVLKNYLPEDKESGGDAVHMIWRNPLFSGTVDSFTHQRGRAVDSVRVASVQFQARPVTSFKDFMKKVEYFVDVAADYHADFILFPELLTLMLLSIEEKKLNAEEAIDKITSYTDKYVKAMSELALSYNINIIGGTHPSYGNDGDLLNIAYVFLRNGETYRQPKIQPTPSERFWWNMKGGDELNVIQTDCGPIGVLVCYDAEFPELSRHLADQGALILFVPFNTDERQGYIRVKTCTQARAIENQLYVVTAGMVGNLPDVENMDIHYAESHIVTPCDFMFARDGVAALAAPNTEMIIFADLSLDDLLVSRHSGTVQNLKDRRFDLYQVKWYKN
jgi:predicted amidohydrolase/GNAT superfamily N-acetyltransferase